MPIGVTAVATIGLSVPHCFLAVYRARHRRRTPMFWQAASVIIGSVLALVTVGVLIMNQQQVKASRKQAQASEDQAEAMREQVRVSRQELTISREQFRQNREQVQETLQASLRPFLFPSGTLPLKIGNQGGIQREYFDFGQLDSDDTVATIRLKNAGAGIALNVWVALVQPRPKDETSLKLAPRMRSVVLDAPLPA